MNLWVIYKSPKDFPGKYVARRWWLDSPTGQFLVADSLDDLRAMLPTGLDPIGRMPGDDPVIVEVWI